MRLLSVSLLTFFGGSVASASQADFKTRCEALSKGVTVQGYHGIKVPIAQYVTKNTTIDQFAQETGTNATCALPNPVVQVDLCRVALNFPTSDSSEVYMEAWLPENWNSRFLAVGTGGLAGCEFPQLMGLHRADMRQASSTRNSRT
jgi:feruloyl esterase